MTDRELMQMALDALEHLQTDIEWQYKSPTRAMLRKVKKALRAALAQEEINAALDRDDEIERLSDLIQEQDKKLAEYEAQPETEPVAWILKTQIQTGEIGEILSWSQSGEGLCERLFGEENETPLYTSVMKCNKKTDECICNELEATKKRLDSCDKLLQEEWQARQALLREHPLQDIRCECCGYMTYEREHLGCIRSAYRTQTEQEPFCYHDGRNIVEKEFADHSDVFPLYTTPQPAVPERKPWVGLTQEDMYEIGEFKNTHGYVPTGFKRLAAAIEAKLKEKNDS